MKRLSEKFERLFSAVTFAEAGEFDTAREIMKEEADKDQRTVVKKRKGLKISVPATESR